VVEVGVDSRSCPGGAEEFYRGEALRGKTTWSRRWGVSAGIENPSPLRGEKRKRTTHFHGFRVGGLCRAAAPPVATTRGPFGARSKLFSCPRKMFPF
jgi:hypothetical protein